MLKCACLTHIFGSLHNIVDATRAICVDELADLVYERFGVFENRFGWRNVCWLILPERANVDFWHFGRAEDFAQIPHQSAANTNELFRRHRVAFVEDDEHFFRVTVEALDYALVLVAYVDFSRVEEEDNFVNTIRKIAHNFGEIVAARVGLLLASEDAYKKN